MSATEQMRAMLDGLMGTARDGSDSQRQHLHFTDPRVCRAFLLDCCPHDIFASTKLELGECSKVHDPALRADYIIANKVEDYMYEVSALERLQSFVNEADKKTDYLKKKLAETQEELTAEETNKLNRVHELTEKLGKKLAQVEKAEQEGELEAMQKFSDEADRIKKERSVAEAEYKQVSRPASSHQQQNLRVCDICSAYLGINDNDSRLADHFGGKLHLGFITVREKLDDLKKIVSEKKRRGGGSSSRSRAVENYDYDGRGRMYDRHRDRYRERERDRERDRERVRDDRYHDRSRSNSRYYRDGREGRDSRDSRSRDRRGTYDRTDRAERVDHIDERQDREHTYQRRLREFEKREAEKARKYAMRISEERDRKQLEEQESRKLKEFLEDYKDDRDDMRFYRGSALARRLADRRKEIEQDELARQREKKELEILSRSCAATNSSPQPIECAETIVLTTTAPTSSTSTTSTMAIATAATPAIISATTATTIPTAISTKIATTATTENTVKVSNGRPSTTGSSSEDKRKQVEELIGKIPTDKNQLFARELDWSLLDQNLMEKRIRPWVTKKIAEYMGEKEVELIDFVCTLLSNRTDGNSVLREVAIVLDEEAEKFVIHMWRLLIFELEAKKIGLRR